MTGLERGLAGHWGWPAMSVPQMRVGRDQAQPEPDIRLMSLLPPSSLQAPRLPAPSPSCLRLSAPWRKNYIVLGAWLAQAPVFFLLSHSSASSSISSLVSHCTCFMDITQSPLCVTPPRSPLATPCPHLLVTHSCSPCYLVGIPRIPPLQELQMSQLSPAGLI